VRLLLDTQTLLWASVDSDYLSRRAREALLDPRNTLYVSAASAWEAGTKRRKSRLPEADIFFPDFEAKIRHAGYKALSVSCQHAESAASFSQEHKDPFDRILAAQSVSEDLILISNDKVMDTFGVLRIW
jgi:PIN domain nuclease of toxin-antitoxin system